jgi:hypothetical protein
MARASARKAKKPAAPAKKKPGQKSGRKATTRATRGVTFAQVRALALALPGVTEGTSYGTAAFRVGKALLARRHDDPALLVLKLVDGARPALLEDDPDTFFITDHYAPYPAYVLVRLARVGKPMLAMLLEQAWLASAPRKLVKSRA